MSAIYLFLLGSIPFVLVAFAWAFGRKASYHRGAADAYEKVANDFRGLSNATWMRDKAKKEAERRKHWMRLVLCDPHVCDALADALTEGREFWKHKETVK